VLENPCARKLLKRLQNAGEKGLCLNALSKDEQSRAYQLVQNKYAAFSEFEDSSFSAPWFDNTSRIIPSVTPSRITITVSGKDALAIDRSKKRSSLKDRLFQLSLVVLGWLLNSLWQILSEFLSRSVPPIH